MYRGHSFEGPIDQVVYLELLKVLYIQKRAEFRKGCLTIPYMDSSNLRCLGLSIVTSLLKKWAYAVTAANLVCFTKATTNCY
jgi:hypothetical protein